MKIILVINMIDNNLRCCCEELEIINSELLKYDPNHKIDFAGVDEKKKENCQWIKI